MFLLKSWGVGHLLFSAWAGSTSGFSKVPHPQLTPTEWVPLQHRLMGSEAHSHLRGAEGSLGCLCRGSVPPAHQRDPQPAFVSQAHCTPSFTVQRGQEVWAAGEKLALSKASLQSPAAHTTTIVETLHLLSLKSSSSTGVLNHLGVFGPP